MVVVVFCIFVSVHMSFCMRALRLEYSNRALGTRAPTVLVAVVFVFCCGVVWKCWVHVGSEELGLVYSNCTMLLSLRSRCASLIIDYSYKLWLLWLCLGLMRVAVGRSSLYLVFVCMSSLSWLTASSDDLLINYKYKLWLLCCVRC